MLKLKTRFMQLDIDFRPMLNFALAVFLLFFSKG